MLQNKYAEIKRKTDEKLNLQKPKANKVQVLK